MASPDAEVDELLAHGGWRTGDARARHAAAPVAPAQAELRADAVPATEIRKRNPIPRRYLALPPGWASVLAPDGFEDAHPDLELEP